MFSIGWLSERRVRSTAIASLVAVAAGLAVLALGLFSGVERDSRSERFQLRPATPPSGVVVVGIDDPTFSRLGLQWPFKRRWHAKLIDALTHAGARAIVYDIQFTEPTDRYDDQRLLDSIKNAGGRVVLATTLSDGHGHTNVLGGDRNLRAVNAGVGAANLDADPGGLISRFPHDVAGLDSLAVVTAERVDGRTLDPGLFGSDGAWIDYQGPVGRFPTLSFADVVQGSFDPAAVRGKIVVVGAAAPTLQDVHATPTSGSDLMSGPEIQANAIWTALHRMPLRSAPWLFDVLLIVLLGVLVPLAHLRLRRIVLAAALTPLAALGFLVLAQVLFDIGWIVDITAPLTALAVGAVLAVVVSHLIETRERELVGRQKDVLEQLVRARTEEVRENQLEVIWRLSQMAESRDEETGLHIERISSLSEALALALGMPANDAEMIGHAAALHDVGKIGVPDRVLLKPGALDPEERAVMQTHTTIGANVLSGSKSPLLQTAEAIARSHHERWDGGGYPDGLAGTAIPLSARICSVVDVFDALMSKRVYKDAWGVDAAIEELERCSGTQFDPALVSAFVQIAPIAYEQLTQAQAQRRLDRVWVPELIHLDVPHSELELDHDSVLA
jgi:HD-GYP domain-containing protein (c-di-GMP phosphodiesterase class II)/CHASE2 domain-containing sensor protein